MPCTHHWQCDPPLGAASRGVCTECGEIREFSNYLTREQAELLDYGHDPASDQQPEERSEMKHTKETAEKLEAKRQKILQWVANTPTVKEAAEHLGMTTHAVEAYLSLHKLSARKLRADKFSIGAPATTPAKEGVQPVTIIRAPLAAAEKPAPVQPVATDSEWLQISRRLIAEMEAQKSAMESQCERIRQEIAAVSLRIGGARALIEQYQKAGRV
jgi:hypothetical protein